MIEMRWQMKMRHHDDGYLCGPFKVLQYRYRFPQPESAVNSYPPRDWEWSEWLDVKGGSDDLTIGR